VLLYDELLYVAQWQLRFNMQLLLYLEWWLELCAVLFVKSTLLWLAL